MTTKICKICKLEKPVKDFYKSPLHNWYGSYCKSCSNEYTKEWQKIHKERYNELHRKYDAKPWKRLANKGRKSIRMIIRDLRTEPTFLMISKAYTRERFMNHLISTIPEGSTLADYGKTLCVDHKKPCCSFDLTKPEEYAKCFYYKNLRLITKSENLSKLTKDLRKKYVNV